MSNMIPTLPDDLLILIRHGENHQIEYKEARTDLPKSLFDSVCSFSNREGGDIFLGVHNTGVMFGVDPSSAAKLITNFITLANNKDKLFPPLYLAAREYVYASTGSFSSAEPEFIEGDVFKIIIPLSVGSMTKVGPGTSPVVSEQVSEQVDRASEQVAPLFIKLEPGKYAELITFCEQPRTRAEMQALCGIASREYFRANILNPMIQTRKLALTIPDKPNSSKQKYIKA